MSMFYAYRAVFISILLRMIAGIVVIGLGWTVNEIISHLLNPVHYTTTDYDEILLQEWLSSAKPVFFSLVPTLCLACKILCLHVSWKKSLLFALFCGVAFTIPPYLHNLGLWQPLLRTIDMLPVTQVTYEHQSGTFPDIREKMSITFIISANSFYATDRLIKTRLAEYHGASLQDIIENYTLKGISPPNMPEYWYSVTKQMPDKVEARLDRNRF